MVSLNVKVIIRLKQSKRQTCLRTNNNRDRSTQFTISTILIDLIFLIFNLPEALNLTFKLPTISNNLRTIFIIYENFSVLLKLSYSAFLVFIFIIFNRIFRKELFAFFRLQKFVDFMSSTA